MTPVELRTITGTRTGTGKIAAALGISPGSLALLEATPVERWMLRQLRAYCAACGHMLEVVAVDNVDGARVLL